MFAVSLYPVGLLPLVSSWKKTESLSLLVVMIQAIRIIWPDLIEPDVEKAATLIAGTGVIPTLLHRIWRNKKEIGKYIGNKYAWLKRALNRTK